MTAPYVATHHDPITEHLRNFCWQPTSTYTCGCHPSRLCAQRATIRAAEGDHPELAR